MESLTSLFPKHKCGLYLEHNAHLDVYEPLEQYLNLYTIDDWINADEFKLAFDNNSYWKLQWYPDSPVGFYVLLAYNLDKLLEHAVKER